MTVIEAAPFDGSSGQDAREAPARPQSRSAVPSDFEQGLAANGLVAGGRGDDEIIGDDGDAMRLAAEATTPCVAALAMMRSMAAAKATDVPRAAAKTVAAQTAAEAMALLTGRRKRSGHVFWFS
jgi:hypothetical protein